MKRIGIYILSLIVFGFLSLSNIMAFDDLDPNDDSTGYIEEFEERGLINGYPDGTFRPEANISRAEFIALINRTFMYEDIDIVLEYKDVPEAIWYLDELKTAVKTGYIKGYPDKTFRPDNNITREEVAVVLNRILLYTPNVYTEISDEVSSWSRDAVQCMIGHEIMFVDNGEFRGRIPITREETVVSLLTILHQEEALVEADENVEEDVEVTNDNDEDDNSSGSGSKDSEDDNSSGSGSNDSDDDSNSDESDEEVEIPDDDVIYAMNVTINGLDQVLSGGTVHAAKLESNHLELIVQIQENMENYLADYAYDYETEANIVKGELNALPETEQNNIENAINASVPYIYLHTLELYFEED